MDNNTEILINHRINRSRETIIEAKSALENNHFFSAENRIYYAIFYIVSALALKNGYSTSKHSQLKGWFNQNVVHTGIVKTDFGKIYNKAYNNRQEADYQDYISYTKEEVERHFADMLLFVDEIEKIIKQN